MALTRLVIRCAAVVSLFLIATFACHWVVFPFAEARADEARVAGKKWQGWWEFGGAIANNDESRGEVTLFQPLGQTAATLFFSDIRAKLFEDDVREGNVAFGWRQRRQGWNFGAWAGLDVRRTEHDNNFFQLAGGLEALGERWDMRLNGYAPFSDTKSTPSAATVFLRGNQILMRHGGEMALYGVDAEAGRRIAGGRSGRHALHLYGGAYWYDHADNDREITGPKARLEYRLDDVIARLPGSRLTLDAAVSHDNVRDTRWSVGARLRIPFGGGLRTSQPLSGLDRRMTERLERDVDVVIGTTGDERVDDAETDVQLNRVAFANGATGLGPAIAQGGQTLIIAQGGNGTITGGVDLQDNQTLQGGASTIQVRGRKTGTVTGFTAPGSRPFVQVGLDLDVIGVEGSNVHIAGLTIDGLGQTSDEGIDVRFGKSNIVIEQTLVQNVGDKGIDLDDDNSNIRIFNNTVRNAFTDGVSMDNDNTDVTISDMTIVNSGRDGIYTDSRNTNLTIERVTIDTAGFHGIDLGFDNTGVTIRDSNISNADDAGILVFEDNTGVTIANTTISASPNDGVRIEDGNSVTLNGVTINGADDGLEVGIFNTVTMNSSTFSGTFTDDAIDIQTPLNTLGGSGNVFNGVANDLFCEVAGAPTGTFGFPAGPSNCPP